MLTMRIKIALTAGATAALLAPAAAMADPCVGLTCGIGGGGGGGAGGGGGGVGGGDGGGGVGDIPLLPEGGGVPGDNPGDQNPNPVQRRSTQSIADQARDSAELPKVAIHTAPEVKTYVRLRTSLWVDGFDDVETQPITADGQTVQAFAEPDYVIWDLGETQIRCEDGDQGTTCGYTYKRSSAQSSGGVYRITARVFWKVTWACTGACDAPAGVSDPLDQPSEPQPLTVGEIQTGSKPG